MPRLEKIESEKCNFPYFWKIYQYVWVEAAIEQFLGQLDHPSVFHYRLNSFILLTQQMGDERHGTVAVWHCGTDNAKLDRKSIFLSPTSLILLRRWKKIRNSSRTEIMLDISHGRRKKYLSCKS